MIKGLSDRVRLPRAGIIRLGIKKKSSGGKEYPSEVDYFVVPDLVKDVYNDKPKELIVMFPVEDEDLFFPQFYKCYGKGILLCRGDGEQGSFFNFDAGEFDKRPCPCEKLESGACKPIAMLQFLLPEIKEAVGVWQISTSSKNSIVDLNSAIKMVRSVAGRIAMIPLILKRVPMDTHRIENKEIKRGKHFTMQLSLGMSLLEIQKLGQIPPSMALLPSPDESHKAVDDLFPPNGFKPENEATEEKIEEGFKESEIVSLKQKLDYAIEKLKKLKYEFTDKERDEWKVAETAEEIQTLLDKFDERISIMSDGKSPKERALDFEKDK
jgi:hypothetical protein